MAGGGRSNELNPEIADTSKDRSTLRENTEKVAKTHERKETGGGHGHGEEKISYGRKFAQTQEHYVARQMNRELEELAKEEGALDEEPEKKPEAKAKKAPVEKKAARSKMEELGRTAPIGAIPVTSEPPPNEGFGELVTEAMRYGGMIRSAVRDIFTASVKLARLPMEVASLAAHRIRPLRA